MKIQKIQAFPLAYPEPHYKGIERYITLARVESDDGLVGWGGVYLTISRSNTRNKDNH